MKFGPVPVADAAGAVLAHSTPAGDRLLRKAHVLTAGDVAALQAAGVAEIIAARLDADDLGEDAAATRIVEALSFAGVFAKPAATGRVNLHALAAGVFTVDRAIVDAINAVDPAITVATLKDRESVEDGQMVATVKIIPFAVASRPVEQVLAVAARGDIFAVHAFRPVEVGMVQTVLANTKTSVLDKTTRVTEVRLARSGSRVAEERRTPHEAGAVAAAIADMAARHGLVLVFGASAMCDFDDVIPAAIRAAGGTVIRAGMPVDPGNLLVLGEVAGKPVIGAPGCARSPKENGFDWVLDRLLAGLEVGDANIAGMGVGGLLMEIPSRPQPREAPARAAGRGVHVLVLAAGRSSRMAGPNKLTALFSGTPLVRRVAERALASRAAGTIVVTGHQADRVGAALAGLAVRQVHNPDFATGLSSSIRIGIAALPAAATGVLIVLGDMPQVTAADLDRLIAAFEAAGGEAVVRATHEGKRGNPVLLPRALFAELAKLEGDTGARHLIEAAAQVVDIEIGAGAAMDVDTREALESAGGVVVD